MISKGPERERERVEVSLERIVFRLVSVPLQGGHARQTERLSREKCSFCAVTNVAFVLSRLRLGLCLQTGVSVSFCVTALVVVVVVTFSSPARIFGEYSPLHFLAALFFFFFSGD